MINRREMLKTLAGSACVGYEGGNAISKLFEKSTDVVLASGLPTLDKALNGGFRANDLVMILGIAGVGKTSFIDKMNVNAGNNPIIEENVGNYDMLTVGGKSPNYRRNFTEISDNVFLKPTDGSIKFIGIPTKPLPMNGKFVLNYDETMLSPNIWQNADSIIVLKTASELGRHWSFPSKAFLVKNKRRINPNGMASFEFHVSIFDFVELPFYGKS